MQGVLCMLASQYESDAGRDAIPLAAKFIQSLSAAASDLIVSAAPSIDSLTPARDELFVLEIMEVRIDATFAEGQYLFRGGFNRFDDFVSVHLALSEQPQHHEFRHSVQKARIGFLRHGRVYTFYREVLSTSNCEVSWEWIGGSWGLDYWIDGLVDFWGMDLWVDGFVDWCSNAPEGWRTPGRFAEFVAHPDSRQRPGVRRPSAAFVSFPPNNPTIH